MALCESAVMVANSDKTTLWSLRPAGEHAALRQAAQGAGVALRALSLQRLVARDAGPALAAALDAPLRLFTSPAAVRFAAMQARGGLARPGLDIAVGSGTAKALARAGVSAPVRPDRMDSDGVLALPALQGLDGRAIGLVTAPGGRGLLAPTLRDRGAVLRVAEVYARAPLRGGARRVAAFAADASGVLVASSAEALSLLLARLPPADTAIGARLRRRPVVVSSERLGTLLAEAGFRGIRVADGPSPAALIAAAARASPLQ
jgi:uroporphyrinogen-III synthase